MGSKIKNGIQVKSLERLATPRTIVAKREGEQIVDEHQGQRNAKIYADLDPNLKFRTAAYTKDENPTELILNASILVEYYNVSKLISKLPANTTPDTYLKEIFQEQFNTKSACYVSETKLEDILGKEKEIKYSIKMDLDAFFHEYGVRIVDHTITITKGGKKYSQEELKDILGKLPQKEDITKAVSDLGRQHHEHYQKIRDEVAENATKLSELEKKSKSELEELKSGIDTAVLAVQQKEDVNKQNYDLLAGGISEIQKALEPLNGSLTPEKAKFLANFFIDYFQELLQNSSQKVAEEKAKDFMACIAAMDSRLEPNTENKQILKKILEKALEDYIVKGIIGGGS